MILMENVTVRAGKFVLENLSISIRQGSHAVLMGKTGSGKTTILEAVCGLKPVVAGRILLHSRDVTSLKPAGRGIGYVPQDGALFPFLTVREHLEFALLIRRWNRSDIEARVIELATLLRLEKLLQRSVRGLSGGERQRVALGRALANHPETLCLDEPLSALDDETRAEMCEVLGAVRDRTGVSILHVTHSLSEAKTLADQIFVLRDGVIHEQNPTG